MVLLQRAVTQRVVRVFYGVYNELGPGYLERVYRRALAIAFRDAGIGAVAEAPMVIGFRGRRIATFRVDFLVEQAVLIEVKATPHLNGAHIAQLLNYLRATPVEVGLLLNFGPSAELRRLVFASGRKTSRVRPDEAGAAPSAASAECLISPREELPRSSALIRGPSRRSSLPRRDRARALDDSTATPRICTGASGGRRGRERFLRIS
jgi:GxxExxY protein